MYNLTTFSNNKFTETWSRLKVICDFARLEFWRERLFLAVHGLAIKAVSMQYASGSG